MAKLKQKSSLKIILKFYKKYIYLYIGFLCILIIKASISFFSAMLTANMITNIMSINFHEVFRLAVINLIILSIYHFLSFVNTYFYKNLENKVRYDIQQKIIESALNMKMNYYDNTGSGIILTRLTSDIDHISERFKTLTEKIVNIIRRLSYLAYIFILDFSLGLFVFLSVIFVSFIYTIRIHYLSKLKPIVKSQREVVNSEIIETIRAIKDIKTLNCEENVLTLIGNAQREFIKKDNQEYYIGIFLSKLTDLIIDVSNFIFVILGCKLIMEERLVVSVFYVCFLYKDHTYSFANEFGDFRYKLAECRVCADRLISLLYPKNENIDKYGIENPTHYEGNISFENVTFSYVKGIPVLKNITFQIPAKNTVALVGESGSGKSSIAGLIGHLYYKNSGSIKFGDKEINKLSKEFIRNNITIVNQFPYIFNLSIRENFKMINSKISDEEILELCEKVLLKEYIMSLPNGLDSIIGEGGCQLSGGQRQKLCIARALCRNVKVMIFDEATSSLDNHSQNEIMEIIKKLSKKLTIIIIAHRLSTITYADSILLLKNGQIEAMDTHENLLNKNAYYKKLYLKDTI